MSHEELLDIIKAGKKEAALQHLGEHPLLCAQEDEPSALMLSLYHRQPSVAEAIAARRNFFTIFEAAALGSPDVLTKILHDSPQSACAVAIDGFTPLHLACFFGHTDAAHVLLQSGADSNALATNGSLLRPLHSAATNGNLEICRMLLEAGADPDALQQSNFSALHAAALRGNIALAELLLQHGASPAVKADDGRTPAMIAMDSGHPDFASCLGELSKTWTG